MEDALFIAVCQENYAALFQMLRQTIDLCTASLWDDRSVGEPFWQRVYHTLFYLDFYLAKSPESFRTPGFVQEGAANLEQYRGPVPNRQQMLEYLEVVSQHCEQALADITPAELGGQNTFPWTGERMAHRLVYNIRHAQHHVGDLNAVLWRGQRAAAGWVIKAHQE